MSLPSILSESIDIEELQKEIDFYVVPLAVMATLYLTRNNPKDGKNA